MMFRYSEGEPFTGKPGDVWKMDGTALYLSHFNNLLFLKFMAKNGDIHERFQAEKEIVICERKLKFWEHHPNYVAEDARRGMEKAKLDWGDAID